MAMEEMMAMEEKIDNPNVFSGHKEQHFSHLLFSLFSFILISFDIMWCDSIYCCGLDIASGIWIKKEIRRLIFLIHYSEGHLLGHALRRLLSFKEDFEVLLLLIFNCWLAKTKSKEGRVSNLFGKEGDRFISTPWW